MIGASYGEDVVTEPADEHGHVVGQGDRPISLLAHQREPLGLCMATTVPLGPRHAPLLPVTDFEDAVATIVQEPDQLAQIPERVKDVATARCAGPGQTLPRSQTTTGVGDGGVRAKTVVLQLQQPDAPGVGVAVFFETEQVAERRRHIDTDENRLPVLKDLVVRADADRGQIVVCVVIPGQLNGGVDACRGTGRDRRSRGTVQRPHGADSAR